MPLHISEAFTRDVTVGFLVTIVGAVLIMIGAVCWQYFGGWAPRGRSPFALSAFCAVAVGLFSAGLIWQLVGYLQLGYARASKAGSALDRSVRRSHSAFAQAPDLSYLQTLTVAALEPP